MDNCQLVLDPRSYLRPAQKAEVKVSAQGDVGIKAKSAFHCISANALCAYSADTFNPIVH